ncbi:MAG: HAD hydrolase family protein, partial [Ruminococcus sp.]|nr:HAD hydrolase family protein [Ruminococcus sp.]
MRLLNKITMTEADFAFRKTVDITPDFLKKHGIKGLILDVDNTLTTHDNPVPADGITEWLENMRNNGIKLIIVSNNHPERVKPFADPLGLDFVSDSGKPL